MSTKGKGCIDLIISINSSKCSKVNIKQRINIESISVKLVKASDIKQDVYNGERTG